MLEIIPKVRRRETSSAVVTVTEEFSWERGVGGLVAGRSVPGCGCSLGGRSGSGGLRVEHDRGNSDALGGGDEQTLRTRGALFILLKANIPTLISLHEIH